MILADKIIKLRKKNGWSQEELAEKIDVSRQAVSKWESASAIPSLEKILQLCALFGVTSDYLLKDEMEDEEFVDEPYASEVKRVSPEEAIGYIEHRRRTSWKIAVATFLCILSPITLLILYAALSLPDTAVSETLAGVIGFTVLFLFVACAVVLYIDCGFKNTPYAFLEKSVPFELEYGVSGIVNEKLKNFRNTYTVSNMIATCLCILSPIPLIVSAFTENDFFVTVMLSVTMILAGIGVFIFIVVGVQHASMQKLLKEGEFTLKEKQKSAVKKPIGFAYWGIVVAVYLAWSFLTNDWHITWLTFAVGGVLFPVLMMICNILIDRHNQNK